MSWTEEQIKSIFSRRDFERGKEYYARGQVQNLTASVEGGLERMTCDVVGSSTYRVSCTYTKEGVRVVCNCSQFASKHSCMHIAAGMLAYAGEERKGGIPLQSDSRAKGLLQAYMERTQSMELREEKARLVPLMHLSGKNDYPTFTFQVGFDRLYVVRDIKAFVDNVSHRWTVSYGKGLKLFHGMEQFDGISQRIIELLMDQFVNYRTQGATNKYGYYYDSAVWSRQGQKNEITLTGSAFDRLFDILREAPVKLGDGKSAILLDDGEPGVKLSIRNGNRAAELGIEPGAWSVFGSSQSLYAVGNGKLLRCGEKFRTNVKPLLDLGAAKVRISFSDLPSFCGCVLPSIRDQVDIEDPDGLLQTYLPDECTPCFYLDMDGNALVMRLAFRYGGTEFDSGRKAPPDIKRDLLAEQWAKRTAEQYFQEEGKRYILTGDDAIFDFLTEKINGLHQRGEVFITDRLRAKRVQPATAGVGISVSGGLLSLNIDTGGFPPEELELLYQSLLKKRRYHRLKDGRYLTLDGSSCETLAEMAHMLQISPSDLRKGEVKLPAFRGLYLDSLLADSDGVRVRRDKQFRDMIRSFKSVSESDYTVPPELEGVLRPYQKAGFQWLKTLESCGFGGILADEMGLGKTVQLIAFLTTVSHEKTGMASLVICPASLILNWMDELAKFAPELKAVQIMGTAGERKRLIRESGGMDVWVTSYELLRQDVGQYQDIKFYCCVLDEGQHIKNQSTLASKAVKRVDCVQRFVLTGTPIENRLSELWNLFDFLMPGYLYTHSGFVEKLEKPVIKSGDSEAAAQLRRMVKPFMLRRLKKDVLKELPPKNEYVRRIPLSGEERKVYFASAAEARRSLAENTQGKFAVLAALTQLRQICCAPGLCFENYAGPNSKLEAALELCAGMAENGHQILLFSQFTSMLDLIRQGLDGMKISNFTLQGSTPKEKRAQLVRSFNAGGASVFLISLKAGGTGLNLTAADVVIHYDPWWNLAAQDQATDRAHRIGQQSRVQVYKLIAENTIEEKILELQSQKAALMDTVNGGENVLEMSEEELLSLLG